MVKDTTKRIQDIQSQQTPPSTCKRKREDVDLDDGLESADVRLTLSNKKRPKTTPKSAQKCNKCAELSDKNDQLQEDIKQLKIEKKQLSEATKEHKTSLRKLYDAYDELDQENEALKAKLKRFEKDEEASRSDLDHQAKSQSGT